MTIDRRAVLLGAAALASVGVATPAYAATPKERLLAWLTSLQSRSTDRLLVGQEISAWDSGSYDRFVNGLSRLTGKRPALVGVSINEPGDYDVRVVDMLLDHHQRGGLVTVSAHWTHPWGDYPAGGGKYYVRDSSAPKPDLRQLLNSAADSAPKRAYWRQVSDLVAVLGRLSQAGAVVLLRPFHEMNGPWFWWGHDVTRSRTALVDLWRDLHAYLSARFDNLLWWYSAATSWNAAIRHYYPGLSYVDLAGFDLYDDELVPYDPAHRPDADDWTETKALGHPAGLSELGPAGDGYPRGARALVDRASDTYTTAVFAHSWYSWAPNQRRSLVELPDIAWALDQPSLATLESVSY